MHFILAIVLAFTTLVSANVLHFVNQDATTRTIYFTGNPGMATIAPLTVPGSKTVDQSFPNGWIGNFYSVSQGAVNKPGMLGEIAWNAWNDITFFDVSAIVDPTDNNGVKMMFPTNNPVNLSGCDLFPCTNVYVKPDDVQTQTTNEVDLVCLLGSNLVSRRRGAVAEQVAAVAAQ